MKQARWIAFLAAGLAWAASAPAQDTPDSAFSLDLTCTLPADGPALQAGTLAARIFAYDPRIADVSAREAAQITLSGLAHAPGSATVLRFPLRGAPVPGFRYYLSVQVHPGGGAFDLPFEDRSLYFLDGFQNVFEDAFEESLEITLTPVPDAPPADGGGGEADATPAAAP